jgi:hypothetical protein
MREKIHEGQYHDRGFDPGSGAINLRDRSEVCVAHFDGPHLRLGGQ